MEGPASWRIRSRAQFSLLSLGSRFPAAAAPRISLSMDPTLSGFALGLLLGAAKVGVLGTLVCGIGWWRTHRKLRRLESALPDPAQLDARLASVEQIAEYTASQLDRLVQAQDDLARQIAPDRTRRQLPNAASQQHPPGS